MTPTRRLAWGALTLYAALTLMSIGAFLVMVGKPIPAGFDAGLWRAGYAFGMKYMGAGIIYLGFVAAVAGLASHIGWRRATTGAGLVVGLTLAVETIGAKTGFPFGEHGYGGQLGWLAFGLVPFVIPLSWFLMLYASLGIALRFRRGRAATLLLTALGLFAWDVLMEPAMSAAYPFWVWRSSGVWYGMPVANWLTWLAIGPVIGWLVLRTAGPGLGRLATDPLPRWLYACTGILPLALAIRFGLLVPAVVGGLAMTAYLVAPLLPRTAAAPSAAAGPGRLEALP